MTAWSLWHISIASCAWHGWDGPEHLPHRSSVAIALRVQRLADEGRIERRGPKSRKPWGPDDDRKLEHMRRAGRPMVEIAAALDPSLPSINGRIAERVRKGELRLLVK